MMDAVDNGTLPEFLTNERIELLSDGDFATKEYLTMVKNGEKKMSYEVLGEGTERRTVYFMGTDNPSMSNYEATLVLFN